MTPDGLPKLSEVIAAHGLAPRKALGQNFLLDLNLTAKIARIGGGVAGHHVLEVGPGPGGLTRALLSEGAAKVRAVEKDGRAIPALREIAEACPGRLEVIEGDALDGGHLDGLAPPVRIAANLPYNIGTELLVRWLTPPAWPPAWQDMTLMFQREVADRITAEPGGKAYGRLAVLAQWRCDARIALTLPPEAFTPPPKVHSAVVHLAALPRPRFPADPGALQRITAAAFGQRRKMLRQSLKTLAPDAQDRIAAAGLDPTQRAETVPVEGFCALARAFAP